MKRILLLAALVSGPVAAQDFPLTLDGKFGETTIEAQPNRVVTLDYGGADNVLALGFQPLAVRGWFGPYENTVWPWAQDLLSVDPLVLEGAPSFEKIAELDPDVILAMRSGITSGDFERLSAIAPVVTVPPGRNDFGLNWREQAQRAAEALGATQKAQDGIEAVEARLARLSEENPDWDGKTFAVLTVYAGMIGLYTTSDVTVTFLSDMGLTVHPRAVELSDGEQYYVPISQEILPEIDADVIFWYGETDDPAILDLPARGAMRAAKEGREIFLPQNSLANGGLSYGSLLSLPEAVDQLEPMINAALDGDVTTKAQD